VTFLAGVIEEREVAVQPLDVPVELFIDVRASAS
jgi:hypothetical protein